MRWCRLAVAALATAAALVACRKDLALLVVADGRDAAIVRPEISSRNLATVLVRPASW